MKTEDAEKLSILLLQVRAKLDESIGFVRERCTAEEHEVYKQGVAKVLGNLVWYLTDPLWERYPDVKPEHMGGPYKIDPKIFEPKFYEPDESNT